MSHSWLRSSALKIMRNKIRRSYVAAAALPLLALLSLALVRPPAYDVLANFVFDSYQRLQPRQWRQQTPIRIIAIDDESLARIGQWPWPRSVMAELVDKAAAMGATTIAFDVVFAEPDRLSAEQIVRRIATDARRAAVEAALAGTPSNDALFAAAMVKVPVVLGSILQPSDATDVPDGEVAASPSKAGFVTTGADPRPWVQDYDDATQPLPVLANAAAGVGAMNWLPGHDQIIREVPLLFRQGDKLVPSFAAEAIRTAQGASTIEVRSANATGHTGFGWSKGINAVKIGDFAIETGPHAERLIHFSRTEPRRFIPAWKFLAGEVADDEIKGRLLLVGAVAAGMLDQRATPLDRTVAGIEVHAQMIEHILDGGFLARPGWAPVAELLAALGLGLCVAAIAYVAPPFVGALVGACCVAMLLATSWFAFSRAGLLVDPFYPSITAGLTYLACLVELFWHEQGQRAFIRDAFGRFVSPAVVDKLSAERGRLVLGGEARELTLLFCDLRDFTTLSEGLTAEQLTTFMNDYLTPMTDVILAHEGTVDKYMGDAVMAFWNAPLDAPEHPRQACLAAIAMRDALDQFNADRRRVDAELGRGIYVAKFGVGLNTGTCSVGNLGSVRRFDYSAIGDPVNVASRLDGLTKFYAVDILATEETFAGAPDLAWLEVDEIRVKGRAAATRIFALHGGVEVAQSAAFAALHQGHARMRDAYRARNFDVAASIAETLAADEPTLRSFYERYRALSREAAATPAADWSPIRNMVEK